MADDLNRRAVNDNTKSIKDLTKKFAEYSKSDSSSKKEDGEISGIKAVDNKINDIKDAFTNNTTIKFFKDPIGSLSGGISSVFKPITSIGDEFKSAFGKIGGFFGGGKITKVDKQMLKHLKSIDKNIKGGFTNMAQEGFSLNNENVLSEAIGQVVGREFITKTGFGRSVGFLTKIQTTMSLLPSAMIGATAKGIGGKLKTTFENSKLFKSFEKFNPFKQKGDLDKGLPEGFAELYSQNSDRSERDQKFHNESTGLFGDIKAGFGHLINATNNMSNVIRQSVGLDPIELSNATASALEASDADKDQAEREARKDDKLFQIGQNEQLLLALDRASEKFGLRSVKESIKGTSFSLIDYFKKILAGAGTAAVGGAVGLGTGIAGFFKAIGSGFMYLGANLPLFAKGAASLALMGASLIPFAGSLFLINKALEGFTFKKVGVFSAMLLATGAAIGGFALAVSSGIGLPVVTAAIGLLALAGAALIPFGYAIKLAGSGMEKAALLFDNLGEVGWDKVSKAGDAIKDLASSFNKLAFGGLLDRITGGGFIGFVDNLGKFGNQAGNVIALADAMERLAKVVEPFQNMKFQTNIGDLLKNISKYGEDFDSNAWWDVNMTKAADGLDSFLGTITKHLSANEGRQGVLDSMNRLLENTVTTGQFIGNADNMSAFETGSIQAGRAMNNIVAPVTNVADNSVQQSSSTTIVQEQHIGPNTLSFISSYKGAQ